MGELYVAYETVIDWAPNSSNFLGHIEVSLPNSRMQLLTDAFQPSQRWVPLPVENQDTTSY